MKKFFTFVAAAFVALAVNADLLTFEATTDPLNGKKLTSGDITLAVTDAGESAKMSIDANSQYFGTATAQEQFKTRLKTGGKSDNKIALKLTLAKAGKVTVYARSSSSSAARNVIFTQSSAELLKAVVDDAKAIKAIPEGESEEKSIFPVYSFNAAAGDIDITFDGGTNFYGIKLEAGDGPAPTEGKVFDFTKDTLNTVASIKALSDYTGEAADFKLEDAISSDGKPYVKWNLTTADKEAKVAFKNFPLTVGFTHSSAQTEFVKTYGTYFQVNRKNTTLTFDVAEGESVKFYPKSYSKNCIFAVKGATVETLEIPANSEQVVAIQAAAGAKQIVLKANDGGGACQFTKFEIVAGEVGPLPIDTATITLKFINTLKWADGINAYTWAGEGNPKNAEWPGVAAEKTTEQLCDFDVYKYSFKDSLYTKIIFNDGTNQTDDLEILIENNNKIYDPAKKVWCTESEIKKNYIVNYYDDKNIITFDAYKETGAAVGEWSKDLEIYSVTEDYYITLKDGVSPAATKMVVDGNVSYFAKDPKSINEDNLDANAFAPAYRLKTGGKTTPSVGGDAESDPTNYIEGYCEKDMTLYLAARTGSNSATDRNIIVKQFDKELVNKVLLESDATQYKYGSAGDKTRTIYPLIELKLKEGSFEISYPTGAINIYGILSDEKGEAPEGVENTEVAVKAVKMIENGQIVIIKNGVRYTVMGQRL